ncbi:MAG: DUF4010 domain-containing protein [Planctomycetaceae bacterium]
MQLLSLGKMGIPRRGCHFSIVIRGILCGKSARSRPGGIRTFPTDLAVRQLTPLELKFAMAFCVGLIVLGVWLYPYYQAEVAQKRPADESADGIMVPLCNVVAYLLGPVTLLQPPWFPIGLTVAAVLMLRARDRLHTLAKSIPGQEIITLAQFLVLAGVVLPLLPNKPVTELTAITPFQVWLAVVVVSSLSYGSYLLHKLLPAGESLFLTSVLGGLYSSTATTVVLARQLKRDPSNRHEFQSGIVLATALMYLRVGRGRGYFQSAAGISPWCRWQHWQGGGWWAVSSLPVVGPACRQWRTRGSTPTGKPARITGCCHLCSVVCRDLSDRWVIAVRRHRSLLAGRDRRCD